MSKVNWIKSLNCVLAIIFLVGCKQGLCCKNLFNSNSPLCDGDKIGEAPKECAEMDISFAPTNNNAALTSSAVITISQPYMVNPFNIQLVDSTLETSPPIPGLSKVTSVAKIVPPSKKHCTGFMISKNHMMTAGHCVLDDNGNRILSTLDDYPSSLRPTVSCSEVTCVHFSLLQSGDFSSRTTNNETFRVAGIKYTSTAPKSDLISDYDFAIIELEAKASGTLIAGDIWGYFTLAYSNSTVRNIANRNRLYRAGFGNINNNNCDKAIQHLFPCPDSWVNDFSPTDQMRRDFDGEHMHFDSSHNCRITAECQSTFSENSLYFRHQCNLNSGDSGGAIVDAETGIAIGIVSHGSARFTVRKGLLEPPGGGKVIIDGPDDISHSATNIARIMKFLDTSPKDGKIDIIASDY